ncbi:hypothetical protein DFH08DRAFT_894766 [Mycena albidolilacea]|uniref:Uncharacterized protein n=1 Tax=Mycena albidolilacea TaxID=1033008 RepID=A0AAD6ZAT4_9AGAR|nr:hypothetical protein DFH08DRAFT_894766 [Mycena albidolilacea]
MISFPLRVAFIFTFIIAVQSLHTAKPSPSSFSTKTIFQSSLGLENIAVRASSELLLTSFASPTLFTFDLKPLPSSHLPERHCAHRHHRVPPRRLRSRGNGD